MPNPGRISLGEALITTTLLSIYLGSRGAALAIAAAQTSPALCANAAAAVRRPHVGDRTRRLAPPATDDPAVDAMTAVRSAT